MATDTARVPENAARLAGVGLLGAFGAGLLEHSVGDSIGGVRLHGVHDVDVIASYYGHPEIRVIAWASGALLLFLGLFGGAMRAHLRSVRVTLWADVFAAFVAADVAILMVHYGLNMAMATSSRSGGATRCSPCSRRGTASTPASPSG